MGRRAHAVRAVHAVLAELGATTCRDVAVTDASTRICPLGPSRHICGMQVLMSQDYDDAGMNVVWASSPLQRSPASRVCVF